MLATAFLCAAVAAVADVNAPGFVANGIVGVILTVSVLGSCAVVMVAARRLVWRRQNPSLATLAEVWILSCGVSYLMLLPVIFVFALAMAYANTDAQFLLPLAGIPCFVLVASAALWLVARNFSMPIRFYQSVLIVLYQGAALLVALLLGMLTVLGLGGLMSIL